MQITLSNHDILYWLEGCARGSHLRQDCWKTMINQFHQCKNEEEYNFFYHYVKRDLAELYKPSSVTGIRHCGADDFDRFLACYNPANRYVVTAKCGRQKQIVECYKFQYRYFVTDSAYIPSEYIKNIKHHDFQRCRNPHCPLHDQCVRYNENSIIADVYQYTETLGCEWFIANTDTGIAKEEE